MENVDYKFRDLYVRAKHYEKLLSTRPVPEVQMAKALADFDAFMARIPNVPPMTGDELV